VVVLEGAELLSVALTAGARVESVYVAPEGRAVPAVTEVVDRAHAAGARVFDLAPGVIERITDTVTPQPVVAVVGFAPAKLEEVRNASLVLVCVDVRDPGNAGTVIRTADAAGVDAVICCDGTVDPTNPKTVRSSAGSLFHLPVVSGGSAEAVIETLRTWGFTTVGSVVRDGMDYTSFDWRRPVALVFGNEASGLSGEVTDQLDVGVTIPMAGRAESLNVSVSAAVLCFEALRQRRVAGDGSRSTMPGMDGATGRPGTTPGGGPGEAPS
jgi:TrmH family RNA methyltransferase